MTDILSHINKTYAAFTLAVIFTIVGSYLTLRFFLPQIRYFVYGIRLALGFAEKEEDEILHILNEKDIEETRKGDISHFDSLSISLSAVIGTGSIAGVIFAIYTGGPGALFWMWVTAFLGMAIKYTEAVLSVKYRVNTNDGYSGGPMYYMRDGLKIKSLGTIFAILLVLASLLLGNLIQVNTTTAVLNENSMNIPWAVSGAALAIFTALIISKNMSRIPLFARYTLPAILFIYLIMGIYILISNHEHISAVFNTIFKYAFNSEAAVSGTITGFLLLSVQSGISQAVFSSESGLGSASIAAASAKTDYTVKQGLVSMLVPFFDTLIVCTITGILVILAAQKHDIFGAANLVQNLPENFNPSSLLGLLTNHFPTASKTFNSIFFSAVIFIFALSTLTGWYFYADKALSFLKVKKKNLFKIFYLLIIFPAYLVPPALLWNMSTLLISIIAVINLTVVLILSGKAAKETKVFFQKYPHKHDIAVRIYLYFLGILPKNTLSKIFGLLAGLRLPRFMMIPILMAFARIYRINVNEAELEISDYKSLNNFFTRALKTGARIVEPDTSSIVSPVDGRIIHFGKIEEGKLLQTKGILMSLKELLGSETHYDRFLNGKYSIIYLSPQDYHRIHSPCSGKIIGYYYKPGKLYPVNLLAVNSIDGLFSKNERLITYIQTNFGLVALVKVGATSVGRIKVTYDNDIATNRWKRNAKEIFYEKGIDIKKGDEIGRFEMGSTVIMLTEAGIADFLEIEQKQKLLFGQPFAVFQPKKKAFQNADNITKPKAK